MPYNKNLFYKSVELGLHILGTLLILKPSLSDCTWVIEYIGQRVASIVCASSRMLRQFSSASFIPTSNRALKKYDSRKDAAYPTCKDAQKILETFDF